MAIIDKYYNRNIYGINNVSDEDVGMCPTFFNYIIYIHQLNT